MSFRKVALVCGLIALLVSGCGIAQKPVAGSKNLTKSPGWHGVIDDQRGTRVACLTEHHIPFRQYLTQKRIKGTKQLLQAIRIEGQPDGANVIFYPEAEVAEGQAIMGQAVGAELIGSALLYPNHTYGGRLTTVENCVATGVN